MKATNIQIEYLNNPIGIGIINPRISWICDGGITQTAYRITIIKDGKCIGDSGKITSSNMFAFYADITDIQLKSRDCVQVCISLWDELDIEGESEYALFEMGILHANELIAKWITGNYEVDSKKRYPADYFCKVFNLEEIKKARLYISACGLYIAKINGERVGSFIMAPGHTNAKKKLQLQTYDVTELLKEGKNTFEIILADGWYRGACGVEGIRNNFGMETKVFGQLEITRADGSIDTIITDDNFMWSNDGPIRLTDNKEGETFDAEKEPSYSGSAKITSIQGVSLVSSNNVIVEEHEHFAGEIIKNEPGKIVIDFKQNSAGYCQLHFKAKAGQKISLIFGEIIDEKGDVSQRNLILKGADRPFQRVEYIAKEGINIYKPSFSIFGFQYLEIEGAVDELVTAEAITVYSSIKDTISFNCSNEYINKFVECTRWSFKNNSVDIPTDCPTRERSGWTGDAEISLGTALYFFDYVAFCRKFIGDMQDEQQNSGCYTQIAPQCGDNKWMRSLNNSPGWADAGVIMPYIMYKNTSDIRFLSDNYESMRRFAEYRRKQIGKPSIIAGNTGIGLKDSFKIVKTGQGYGEWAEPNEIAPITMSTFVKPHVEENTAYAYWTMILMSEIAKTLGKNEDKKRYEQAADKVKRGYQSLVRTKRYSLDTDRQCRLVRPLYMELLDEEQTEFASRRLIQALDKFGWRVGTGFLSTPLILYVLEKIDKELAYKLLENEEMPGWLYMPKSGATTIWESWEGHEGSVDIGSLDHYSKGAVCQWIFERMCGIKVTGKNQFSIAPIPGGHITKATMSYDSIFGTVSCGWNQTADGKYTYKIAIPANTIARVEFPGMDVMELKSGIYEF